MPDSIYEKRIRDLERLANTKRRALSLALVRPQPPRGVKFSDNTVVWEDPRETRNVTHYNIYAPDERTLYHRAPLGQTVYAPVYADTALVSSWNQETLTESRKVPAAEPIPWLTPLSSL